jgi:PBP1b-binding outer membrane lipoprotein LpoB
MKSKQMAVLLLLGSIVVLSGCSGRAAKQLAQPSPVAAASGTELTDTDATLSATEATDDKDLTEMDAMMKQIDKDLQTNP